MGRGLRSIVVLACLSAGLCAPGLAFASPLFELVGADDAGFAGRAMPSGARAAYFNPALLLESKPGLSAGFFGLMERLDVGVGARGSSSVCARGACDVPAVNGAGPESFRHEDGEVLALPTLPTAWLERGMRDGDEVVLRPRPRQGAPTGDEQHGYLSLGLLQAPIPDRFAFGVSVLLPLSGFMEASAFYPDEREQFFSNSLHHELYGDRLSTAGLALGAGLRIVDRLSVGVSLTLSIASAANAPVYVSNLADLDTLLLDSEVNVATELAPHVGLSYAPVEPLRFTATVHSPQGTTIETSFSYIVATGIEQRASQRFQYGYVPWTFGLGAELMLGDERASHSAFAIGSTYALWSQYRDRHDERPSDRAWADLLDVSLTARRREGPLAGFVSVTYEPTPVPNQTGRTSYVDSDRIAGALGASYVVLAGSLPLTFALHAQLHRVLPRSTTKDPERLRDEVPDDAVGGTPRGPIEGREGLQTNNPGFPSFTSEGWLAGLGAQVSLSY